MRTRLVLLPLLMALLTACGGAASSGGATTGASRAPTGGPAASAGEPATSSAPGGNGSIDCAKIKTAAVQLLAIQFLAQLRTPETVEAVKTKQIGNLDLDAFLAAMHDLHALDGASSPLGDPKAAIDTYESAAQAAQTLFATDPLTQAAIDAYNAKVGTVADFLGHQVAIAGAMDAAGC